MDKIKIICEENTIRDGWLHKACKFERLTDGQVTSSQELWLEIPSSIKAISSHDAEPFLLMLVLTAMLEARSIEIEGSVSSTLLANLSELQAYWLNWLPKTFHPVEINPSKITHADPKPRPYKSVLAFSGESI